MEGRTGAAAVEEVNGAIAVEEVHGAAAVVEVHGAAAVNSLNVEVVNPAVVETAAAPLQGDAFRKSIVRFVILSKLPFGVVESNSFKRICNHLHPHMNIPSRKIVFRDCYKMFLDEKLKLKAYFKSKCSKIAFTTDCWTSTVNFSCISLTAHFIDGEGEYQKRIISFSLVPNHMGDTIRQKVEELLNDWGLRNVSTVTINNASSNDVAAMVRDILAMPVSSVALESIFSRRVRLLDSYRSSLGPKVVEVLICSQNWLKSSDGFEIDEGEIDEGVVAEVNEDLTIWCWEAPAGVAPAPGSSV